MQLTHAVHALFLAALHIDTSNHPISMLVCNCSRLLLLHPSLYLEGGDGSEHIIIAHGVLPFTSGADALSSCDLTGLRSLYKRQTCESGSMKHCIGQHHQANHRN